MTAHAKAGELVRIPIPLTGIDPDGDTVTLSGQTGAPRLGAVSGVGADSIDSTPGPFAAGTDEFQYTVVDAQATGLVRVGVLPPTEAVQPPVPVDDAVAVRPGSPLKVDVTQNVSDPQGGALTVIAAEGADGLVAAHGKKTIELTAPATPGAVAVLYTVRNPRGGTASAWLYLDVRADAPLAAPVASDVRVPLTAVDGKETVAVDALGSVTFSEGGTSALTLRVPGGFPTASVSGDRLRVKARPLSQVIPYTVARKDDPSVSATAFVWVPGYEDAAPERRADAPQLTTTSGEPLTIRIGDYVVATAGRKARIVDAASVTATYSDGQPLVVDETTLRYTPAKEYFGPASCSPRWRCSGRRAASARRAVGGRGRDGSWRRPRSSRRRPGRAPGSPQCCRPLRPGLSSGTR
ncbi:Ig-like domain-containing protein [Leifsonia xyli]|uniref:Ig-like domain-containing protein n=1 Tax=Leifsonia xyli TaxID=1575 RepID=UPI00031B61D6